MDLVENKKRILKLIKEAEGFFEGTGKTLQDIDDYVAEYLTANGVVALNTEASEAEKFKVSKEMLEKIPEEDLSWIIILLLLFKPNWDKSENTETKENKK